MIIFFSCIDKWLKGQGGKCPQCNAKAKRQDIRVLYAKCLKVGYITDFNCLFWPLIIT
jgi:hypothetical protein